MALFAKKTWKDRVAEFAGRRTLTKVSENGNEMLVDVKRSEGAISEIGDAFSKENMNDLEKRIADGFGVLLTATLAANATSVSFTNAAITSTALIDIYTDVYGVSPKTATVSGNTLTLTFTARSAAVGVTIIARRNV